MLSNVKYKQSSINDFKWETHRLKDFIFTLIEQFNHDVEFFKTHLLFRGMHQAQSEEDTNQKNLVYTYYNNASRPWLGGSVQDENKKLASIYKDYMKNKE